MTLQDLKKLDRAALLRQYEIEVGKPGQAKWATEDVIRKIRQYRDSRPRPVRVNRASLPPLRCAQCPKFVRRDGWLCPSCQEKGVSA